MFCPKCGTQNPETGKFCRSCGTDLGNVSNALSGTLPKPLQLVDRRGRPVSWEKAIVKIFTGVAFLCVAVALSFSIGKGWWFWMLIPAFTSLGAGIAQFLQTAEFFDLGLDYDVRLPEHLAAVTLEQVRTVARDYLSPDRATVVVAGPYSES